MFFTICANIRSPSARMQSADFHTHSEAFITLLSISHCVNPLTMQLSPTRWDGAFNRLRGLSCPLLCLSKVQRDEQLPLTAVKRIAKCFGKAIYLQQWREAAVSPNYCSREAEKQLYTSPKEFFGTPLTIPGISKGLFFCHITFSCDTSSE